MNTELMQFKKPTQEQIEIAGLFDLDSSNDMPEIVFIKIVNSIKKVFNLPVDSRPATREQIAFAELFHIDVSDYTIEMASLVISKITEREEQESIKRQSLKPRDSVQIQYKKQGYSSNGRIYIISSIKHGMVYFKGGNGKRAFARNVRKGGCNIVCVNGNLLC
jgi:hypothetical protein